MTAITNSIVGVAVGLILALIIVLILQNTVFKDKKMTILYVVLFVIFAVSGGLIQNRYFTVSAEAMPTPQEQIKEITTNIEENWKNTNGGFTFEQIKKAQDDNECPAYDDQIINLKCYDFGSYIVFSYENDGRYENALFYKSKNGLILDGVINTYASLTGMKWFFAYDLSTFGWATELNKEPYYYKYSTFFDGRKLSGTHDDLVSVSRQTQMFVKWTYSVRTNQDEMVRYVMKNASNLTAQNITSHFIKFKDVELIGTGNTGFVKINSFYNYLYEQIKGESFNTVKIIDGSNCLCMPIPSAEKPNYPISPSKKAEYGDAEFYGVYRCNIGVNLSWVKGNETIDSTTENEDYIDTLVGDDDTKDKVEIEKIAPNYNYTKLNLSFIDTKDSDISNVNLLIAPVEITLSCSDKNLTKTILIDSKEKLNSGLNVLLTKNTTWDFFIDSEALIFENFRGSFTVKSSSSALTFQYYYLNNYTIASVGLNPVGTIDKSLIDLSKNPVKVILSNANHTYQFLFNDSSLLESYQSTLVEMGEYNYTILSKQLIFASVTGKLTITTKDKIMLFNYALGTDDPLIFSLGVTSNGTTNKCFQLYSLPENVTLIRNTLSSAKVFTVTCVIYDEDGRLMETFNHTHQDSGTCSDTWYANNLVAGQKYTLQLRFADRDDSTITYLSDISIFTYQTNTTYKVTYTVTENK
ncbi:MAG: hypothetical protein RR247_02630 [Clostridia bacterium]